MDLHLTWDLQLTSKSKGSLIHLPSKTTLFDKPLWQAATRWINFEKPRVFLVLEKVEDMCVVSYQGKSWYVREKEVYTVEENL